LSVDEVENTEKIFRIDVLNREKVEMNHFKITIFEIH